MIKQYDKPEDLALAFALWFNQHSKEKLQHQEYLTLALSGGSTPQVLFDYWVANPDHKPDWSRIHIFWVDERCVPPNNKESNYRMTREHLLQHIDMPDTQIHRIKGENNAEKEAQRYGKELQSVVPMRDGWPCFDVLILGMGADGHTASIFPDRLELITSSDFCAVAQHPQTGQWRVSLTGEVINRAKQIAFLVTGESKASKVAQILHKEKDYLNNPAAHIQPTNGQLTWYLDLAAASLLRPWDLL